MLKKAKRLPRKNLIAIDGTMDVTFAGCDELRVEPPNSNHVRLTKQ